MIYIAQNAAAILLATLAGLLAGWAAWRAAGLAPRPGALAVGVIAEAWLCAILAGALILAPPKAGPWTMGLMSAVVIWIGFVAPALFATHAARGAGLRVAAADSARWLLVMLVQAAVLLSVGLTKPPAA